MQRDALVLLLALSLQAASRSSGGPSVDLCEVLANPSAYDQKELTITAGYRAGYEWQEFSCFTCSTREKVWVELGPEVKGVSKIGKAKRFDQMYRVTFVGIFEGGHRYGHMAGYAFQFRVTEVKAAKLLWKLGHGATQIPEQIKAKACQK